MNIIRSFAQYVRTRGRLLYTEQSGIKVRGSRRRGSFGLAQFFDYMEPRILMTTVMGGESFQFVDAEGHTITATLTGSVAAELVSAVQAGGHDGKNSSPVGGYLIFGNIAGKYTSGPLNGVIVGSGSLPFNNGTQGSAAITIPNLSYSSNGDQINLSGLAANASGQNYAFNLFSVNSSGQNLTSAVQSNPMWDLQLLILSNTVGNGTNGNATIVLDLNGDSTRSDFTGLSAGSLTANATVTNTYTGVTIAGAAFDPADGQLYFVLHDTLSASTTTTTAGTGNTSTTTVTTTIVNEMWAYNTATDTFTDIGAVNVTNNASGSPRMDITAIAFAPDPNDTSTTDLWISEQPNGVGGPPKLNPAPAPSLLQFAPSSSGAFTVASPTQTINIFEGYGSARNALTTIHGLASLPATVDGGGSQFLFAVAGTGSETHMVRIDLLTGEGTTWGKTTDLFETINTGSTFSLTADGQNAVGLTYNPVAINPFSGLPGAWLTMDASTENLDDLDESLRISQGDVYSVYSTISDIHASIVFQGPNLYTGNSGAVQGAGTVPTNTGQAFLGFKGEIPDNSTNATFVASTPFLSGTISNPVGIMPTEIDDTTIPSESGVLGNTLYAGLTVANSYEEAFNPSADLVSQEISSSSSNGFYHVTGMAVASDGTIVVMNTPFLAISQNHDTLGFVDPVTGLGTGQIVNIHLGNNTSSNLRGLEAMAFGDPNLTGTPTLYAVYDLGGGPVLGTINTSTGEFDVLGALGLGQSGRVLALAFTPSGTQADPTHETLYAIADPNYQDISSSETLYKVNAQTGAVTTAPTYSAGGQVLSNGGIADLVDATVGAMGSHLQVTAAFFDASGKMLVLDRSSGRLLDLNLSTGAVGANFSSVPGAVNSTVAGVGLDPVTLRYIVVDQFTAESEHANVSVTAAAIMMNLKDFTQPSAAKQDLGKFLFDGTVTGKITVPGSMDLLYAGLFLNGDLGGTWNVLDPDGVSTDQVDFSNYNYFKDNIYIGGDVQNVVSLTNIGSSSTNSKNTEITVGGRIGSVEALGTEGAVIHASNNNFSTEFVDATNIADFGVDGFGFSYKGSALYEDSQFVELTTGQAHQTGSVFAKTLQPVNLFNASFEAFVSPTASSADGGFTFVLQDQGIPLLGGGGTGLGYSGIVNSVGLEFNVDPALGGSAMGLKTNGQIGFTPLANINILDGILVNLTYSGTTLTVSVEDEGTDVIVTKSYTINLANILGSHGAYVGFTGATNASGSTMEIANFSFSGATSASAIQMPQDELQHYTVDADYSFAAGYLASNKTNAPFRNDTFATAQFLGTVRNPVAGQPDLIDLQGELEGQSIPANAASANTNQSVDYFAFGLLAGQTIDVTVLGRDPLASETHGSTTTGMEFGIFNPDGTLVASTYNFAGSSVATTLQFTADRPGAYRIAISGGESFPAFSASNSAFDGNLLYELKVTGLGNMAIGAVVAGGNIVLPGSQFVLNATSSSSNTITNPSIQADTGDIGVIQAGIRGGTGAIEATSGEVGIVQDQSLSQGYDFSGTSSMDIMVSNGNLRGLVGSTIATTDSQGALIDVPDITVNGEVGLISSGGLLVLTTSKPISGDIQIISAAGDLEGIFATNQAIGVIRAGSVNDTLEQTEFKVDADRQGRDGTIDLIDVTGDWGGTVVSAGITYRTSGAPIVTGPGGNVRFMTVGGYLSQDSAFSTGTTGTNGEVVHQPGIVTYTDDSGAIVTLDPGSTSAVNGTNGTVTTLGQLTTQVYGVRGAGGVVIVSVKSTMGLTVTVNAGGTGLPAEIGVIEVDGLGIPVTVTNGVPTVTNSTVNATTGATMAAATATNVILKSTSGGRVDAYAINAGTGATIDLIQNQTPGDIFNVAANDVGTITAQGNIGKMTNTTGADLIGLTTFSNTYPFVDQTYGISVANAGVISAGKGVGNVIASGVIGTVTANSDNTDDPGQFEGIFAPIVIQGTARGATSSTQTTAPTISISQVNIGDGIATQGSGAAAASGIFATGEIVNVTGTNADIRGAITSLNSIGTITLTNGSIINAPIMVVTDWSMTGTFNDATLDLPLPSNLIDAPVYVIQNINIQGNGGIIGSEIVGSSINMVSVAASGFGILNTVFQGVSTGTINNITAGGYGMRNVFIEDARVNSITANGNGTPSPLSSYEAAVRTSEQNTINPYDNVTPSPLDDLTVYILGDGDVNIASTYGLATGLLGAVTVNGQDRLGTVTAYDVKDSQFLFPDATGAINILHDVDDTLFLTGTVASVTVGHNATNFEVTAAGTIGPVKIGGDFTTGTNAAITGLSQIVAKGASGNITSFVTSGNFAGLLDAEGHMGSITIGSAATASGHASTGDFSGTITVGGNHLTGTALDGLHVFGSISGGLIDVNGNTNTIDVAHDFTGLSQDLTVRGNLTNFIVGDDTAVNGSVMGSPLTVSGSVTNATITGLVTSTITVGGGLGQLAINTDPSTSATSSLLTGTIKVAGSLTNAAIHGSVSGTLLGGVIGSVAISGALTGQVEGGKTISSIAIAGAMATGSSISSGLGDITKLTVTGNINGSITAPNGALTSLTTNGSIGSTGSIIVRSLGAITIPGSVAGTISATLTFASLKVGSVTSTAYISSPVLPSVTTTGDLNGVLNIGTSATAIKIAVGGNYGAAGTFGAPMSATVAGSMSSGSSMISTAAITSIAVKGSISGHIVSDKSIGTISALSINNAVIAGGLGITGLTATTTLSNTLVETGLARGVDQVFGTSDLGEQAAMADIGTIVAGSMTNVVIAAGGNITSLKTTGNMSSSIVTSGVVLAGSAIAAALADPTPVANATEQQAAYAGSVLLRGIIKSATIGATGTTMFNSVLAAGVSPGADNTFGTSDDNVSTSLVGGTSNIVAFKGTRDGTSLLLADAPGSGATVLSYNLGSGANSIVASDPVTGPATATATTTSNAVIITASGTITISVKGATGTTVTAYDNPATTDRLDTIVISGPTNSAATVTVTTTSPGSFDLGRILTTDNTQVASFIFNGDLLGDVNGGTSLWIDSPMTTFTARNLTTSGTWTGEIGGDVSKLTLNRVGPGRLRIGGRVSTLTVTSSTGNPLLQQLGTVTPATFITQMAYDPANGSISATDGANLLNVNVSTGAITSTVPFLSAFTGLPLTINGLAYDASGRLLGIATINNQNPITSVGQITTTGDTLHGLAINSQGQIYAIDSQTGTDMLVTLNASTGAETVLGAIRNFSRGVTYGGNIVALAFDGADNLFAITNDADGGGASFSTSDGLAYGRIDLIHQLNGSFNFGNPGTNANGLLPVLLGQPGAVGTVNLAIDSNSGTIYMSRHVSGNDELDTLTITGAGSTTAVTPNVVGDVSVDAAPTTLAGIGVDENGNLIGLNNIGSSSELVGINLGNPGSSVRIDTPNLLGRNYGEFAVGKSGDTFTTYGYTTNSTTGGTLFVSPGQVSSLGVIGTDGSFTEMLPLAQDSAGTGLAGTARSIAIDGSGNIFTVTNAGVLAEYSSVDGSLIGGAPIGIIKDSVGNTLDITRIAFNASGTLVGLNADQNNLVQIATTTSQIGGVNAALARILTEPGTAISSDLTALTFSTSLGKFLSYSSVSGNFVNILGTSPDTLGGLVANSFGAVSIPDAFTSRLVATGNGAANGIDSIKFIGAGTFTGGISSVGSIGAISGTGLTVAGSVVSHGDIPSVAITGFISKNGVFSVDGRLTSFTLTGNMDGSIFAGAATTLTINGSMQADSHLEIATTVTTLTIAQQVAGQAIVGGVTTLKINGGLASGSSFTVVGDAGAVTLGSSQLGSLFLADQGIASLTVGGTLAGVVAARRSIGTAILNILSNGILDVGGDITTLTVNGNVTDSLIASGTWIGADGVYNTGDDVIFGGGIANAKIVGVFTDSLITAGVLPRQGVSSGINNLPTSSLVYTTNLNALNIQDQDSAESGGIAPSVLGTIVFSKPVVSTLPSLGSFSALVAADGITKVTATGALQQIVRTDLPGAPEIVDTTDPVTGVVAPGISRPSANVIQLIFSEAIDTATISNSTISILDHSGNPVTDLVFTYTTRIAPDGSIQGVVQISSASGFNGSDSVDITLMGGPNAPTITDHTGPRSALSDYNQDGIRDPNGDPFGTTLATTVNDHIGPIGNDSFQDATVLTGAPVTVIGSNTLATKESGEPDHGGDSGGASVWWSWTAPATGLFQVDTEGSDFDTLLGVYTGGNVANLTTVASDDDSGGNLTSLVTFNAVAGQTYHIAVDGYGGATGDIVLNIQQLTVVTTSFQQGVNGYTGTVDTQLQLGVTDPSLATNDVIWAEVDPTGDGVRQVLFRFDNIFGTGPGQIPVGAIIISATMTLTTSNVTGGPGPGGQFYAMLQPWNATDTWDTWVDGIQADDIEASSILTTQAGTGVNSPVVSAGPHGYDVTSDVQLFSDGLANNGWVIIPWPGSTDGWGLDTSESATIANRPMLTVVYAVTG